MSDPNTPARSSVRLPGPSHPGGSIHLTVNKTISARLVEIYFRGDHTTNGPDAKLLQPSAGDFDDSYATFTKPEWSAAGNNQPASYTMNNSLVVDLVIDFTVSGGQKVNLTEVQGGSNESSMNFSRVLSEKVGTERKIIYWLAATNKTPASVQNIKDSIDWSVTVDGKPISLGISGPHQIYSTFAVPWGNMLKPYSSDFQQSGPNQAVTEERLRFAVSCASAASTERGCVDAVFNRFGAMGLHYSPGNRWPDTAPPAMSLHHYLWKLAHGEVDGECHMLAAAFILVCEMLGVQGPFQIGYMFPWARRNSDDPYAERPNPVQGRFKTNTADADSRTHTLVHFYRNADHGSERLYFIDANNKGNNFEGVAAYKSSILYAIGESIQDKFPTADENASDWYQGANFDLSFTRGPGLGDCDQPYPDAVKKKRFKWSE